MWSAPGARVNASKTAVPRTPDAPVAYQSTEWGEHLSELACYKDLHGRRRDGTLGLIRKSNKIFTSCTPYQDLDCDILSLAPDLPVQYTCHVIQDTLMLDAEATNGRHYFGALCAANECAHFLDGSTLAVYRCNKREKQKRGRTASLELTCCPSCCPRLMADASVAVRLGAVPWAWVCSCTCSDGSKYSEGHDCDKVLK